jgi:hypothetical protein
MLVEQVWGRTSAPVAMQVSGPSTGPVVDPGCSFWGRVGVAGEQHELPLPCGVADREQWATCGAPQLMIIVWHVQEAESESASWKPSCLACPGARGQRPHPVRAGLDPAGLRQFRTAALQPHAAGAISQIRL